MWVLYLVFAVVVAGVIIEAGISGIAGERGLHRACRDELVASADGVSGAWSAEPDGVLRAGAELKGWQSRCSASATEAERALASEATALERLIAPGSGSTPDQVRAQLSRLTALRSQVLATVP